MIYDHCKLSSAYVLLSKDRYPSNDFETAFKKNNFHHFYNAFVSFKKKFYGKDGAGGVSWCWTHGVQESVSDLLL